MTNHDILPRVLLVQPQGADATADLLRRAGCLVLVDDGDQRSRRAFLPHLIVTACSAPPIHDAVLAEAPVIRWKSVKKSLPRVVRLAVTMARREIQARHQDEMPASWLRLRGLAFSPQAVEVVLVSDRGAQTFDLWRGQLHAERPEPVLEALSDLEGATLIVRTIAVSTAPRIGSFRSVLRDLRAPERARVSRVFSPPAPPVRSFRKPSAGRIDSDLPPFAVHAARPLPRRSSARAW